MHRFWYFCTFDISPKSFSLILGKLVKCNIFIFFYKGFPIRNPSRAVKTYHFEKYYIFFYIDFFYFLPYVPQNAQRSKSTNLALTWAQFIYCSWKLVRIVLDRCSKSCKMLVNLFSILVPIALQNVQGRYRRMRKGKLSYTKNAYFWSHWHMKNLFLISNLGSNILNKESII